MTRYTRYAFCEITERYFGIIGSDMFSTMSTGYDFDKLLPMLHLHFMTKVLTSIGLDHEAVGEPEGLERTFANQSKELMFITQDAVRSRLRKLF